MFFPTLQAGTEGHDLPPKIIIDTVAVSVWDDGSGKVGAQILLKNIGHSSAIDLKITELKVKHGNYVGPATLPASLGNLAQGDDTLFDSIIKVPIDGRESLISLKGTYKDINGENDKRKHSKDDKHGDDSKSNKHDNDEGDKLENFIATYKIAPSATTPGPFTSTPGTAIIQKPNNVSYPPEPTSPPTSFGPNAETPMFIPIGPPRLLADPINPSNIGSSTLGSSAGGASVRIPTNTTSGNAGVPPDPNAASNAEGDVVLSTYNTGISYSVNGGASFTDVNLLSAAPGNPSRTSFFPQSDGGLCCDQVVVYLKKQNLFVWLQQYWPVTKCTAGCAGTTPTIVITQPDRLRIAWATPAAIKSDFWNAWTYADLTGANVAGVSSGLGVKTNEWLDYPDLAWSDAFLYVGTDHGFPTFGQVYTGRRIVARLSLADIANPAASVVNYSYAELSGSNGLNKTHFVQGAPGRMVVGSLDNSSTMRVFTWDDGSSSIPSPTTMGISQIQQGSNYTSLAPDNSDWVAVSFPGNITGATYQSIPQFGAPPKEEYLFAFDAGVNAPGRPRAYVRLETLSPTSGGYQVSSEYDVWNSDYAFAMAALGSDGVDIGLSLAVGGGTVGYPQFSVGFKNDFVVYQVTNSNASQISRFGDYLCARPIPFGAGGSSLFAAEVYDVTLPLGSPSGSTCTTVGCTANMRYVEFGRPVVEPPPIK